VFNISNYNVPVISINGNLMQLTSQQTGNSQTVTQTASTVTQGVPQNQQNIVMVSHIGYTRLFPFI